MNKPEPNHVPTDDEIDQWVADHGYYGHCTPEYHEGLEEGAKWMKKHIESTNKQLIDALIEAQKAIEALPENALGIAELSQGIVWYNRDELLQQIKTALRNAG